MTVPFTDIFVILIDNVLNDQYDKPISRKDYLTFFEQFEKQISRSENESFYSVQINDNQERLDWGRINYEGKRIWKLSCILSTLKEKRILESTGYLPGNHSRRYSYTLAFQNALDFSSFGIVYEEINEKMYNILKSYKEYDVTNPQYMLLKSDRFSIDIDKCNEWLVESFKNDTISKTSCLINIRRVHDIDKKDIYVVRTSTGRVYTSFNSLKRELRPFCYIDGKQLLSVDLKSSQPYLLASYLYKKYPAVKDVETFYNIVTEGDVYDWALEIHNKTEESNINGRDECKVEFYRYILKETNKSDCPIQRIVARELPELYNVIKKERTMLSNNGSSIWELLQSSEAELFIPVCEGFRDDCLSVHDSLYFSRGFEKEIKNELESRFRDFSLLKYKLK